MKISNLASYLIGFLQTDGHYYKNTRNRGRMSIELSDDDEDIIYEIAKMISCNYSIKKRNRKITIKNKKGKIYKYDKNYISLNVYDKEFRDFFESCGVLSGNKSDYISPPLHIDTLSIDDYIRGLYDGDGSLGFTANNFPFVSLVTSSDAIASFIMDYISILTGKKRKNINPNTRDKVYNITITKEDAVVFCEKIYCESAISLNRKKQMSNEIIKWVRPINMRIRKMK